MSTVNVSTSIVSLQPGLYLIRHPGIGLPPVTLSRSPFGAGSVKSLSTDASGEMVLRGPSDCVVVHICDAPANLLVAAYGGVPGVAPPSLRIDRVALDQAAPPAALAAPAPAPAPAQVSVAVERDGLLLVAHIERTGDVVAVPGELLGSMEGMKRVEGFQVEWVGRPEGVDVAYATEVEGHGRMPVVTTGHFSGTRQSARRVTGVVFNLVGPKAGSYMLEGTAYFSGGFAMPISAASQGMTISGPSGSEHLIGLRIEALPKPASKRAAPRKGVWDDAEKTKVFSAKTAAPKRGSAATRAPKAPVKTALTAAGRKK